MEIKIVPITSIKPYWRNPRINDHVVDELADSISRFGYSVPIVVDTKNVILAGHARYRALVKLKMLKISVVVVDLPESKAKEFRIADNKTSEFAEWDMEKLKEELMLATEEDVIGFFDTAEWNDIMDVSSLPSTDPEGGAQDGQGDSGDRAGGVGAWKPGVTALCPHCGEENDIDKQMVKKGEEQEAAAEEKQETRRRRRKES